MRTFIGSLPNRRNFVRGRFTLEIGYPWITPGSIMALEEILNKEMEVLEFGCGGSTVFFANRVKTIKSFETDFTWYTNTKKIADQSLYNIDLTCGTMQLFIAFIESEPDNKYDIVLIDSDPKVTNRLEIAKAVVPKVKPSGWIVVDNYERWGLGRFRPEGWKIYTYDDIRWNGGGTRLYRKG